MDIPNKSQGRQLIVVEGETPTSTNQTQHIRNHQGLWIQWYLVKESLGQPVSHASSFEPSRCSEWPLSLHFFAQPGRSSTRLNLTIASFAQGTRTWPWALRMVSRWLGGGGSETGMFGVNFGFVWAVK